MNHKNGSNLCSFPTLLCKRKFNLIVLCLGHPFPDIFPSQTVLMNRNDFSLDILYCSSFSGNEVI